MEPVPRNSVRMYVVRGSETMYGTRHEGQGRVQRRVVYKALLILDGSFVNYLHVVILWLYLCFKITSFSNRVFNGAVTLLFCYVNADVNAQLAASHWAGSPSNVYSLREYESCLHVKYVSVFETYLNVPVV